MPKRIPRDAKDFAAKRTMNPPGKTQKTQVPGIETVERQPGQYTGRGTPPIEKK